MTSFACWKLSYFYGVKRPSFEGEIVITFYMGNNERCSPWWLWMWICDITSISKWIFQSKKSWAINTPRGDSRVRLWLFQLFTVKWWDNCHTQQEGNVLNFFCRGDRYLFSDICKSPKWLSLAKWLFMNSDFTFDYLIQELKKLE